MRQNNPHWPYRRLDEQVVRAILCTASSPDSVVKQLARNYGIRCSTSMVKKIRAGTRRVDVSRAGTLYDPATGTHLRPTRRGKRIARHPEYLTTALRLRKGYELRPVDAACPADAACPVDAACP